MKWENSSFTSSAGSAPLKHVLPKHMIPEIICLWRHKGRSRLSQPYVCPLVCMWMAQQSTSFSKDQKPRVFKGSFNQKFNLLLFIFFLAAGLQIRIFKVVYYGTLFASRNCSLLLVVTLWFADRRMWFCKLSLCYNTSTGVTAWTCMSGDLQTRVTVIGQASTWPGFQLSALLLFLYAENEEDTAWTAIDGKRLIWGGFFRYSPLPNICGAASFFKSYILVDFQENFFLSHKQTCLLVQNQPLMPHHRGW